MLRRGDNRKSPPRERASDAEENFAAAAAAADRNGNASANERAIMISSSAGGSSTLLASRDRVDDHDSSKRAVPSDEQMGTAGAAAGAADGVSSELGLGHDEDGDEDDAEIMSIKGNIFDHVDVIEIPEYVRAHDTSLTFPEKVRSGRFRNPMQPRKFPTSKLNIYLPQLLFVFCDLMFFILCSLPLRPSAQHDIFK
jgi:hypothetical protein